MKKEKVKIEICPPAKYVGMLPEDRFTYIPEYIGGYIEISIVDITKPNKEIK